MNKDGLISDLREELADNTKQISQLLVHNERLVEKIRQISIASAGYFAGSEGEDTKKTLLGAISNAVATARNF